MGEVNARYFKGLMADKELSLRQLAAKMDMNHSQLSLTLSGARRMQLDEAAQLSQIFHRPLHEIVTNAGVALGSGAVRRVSVVGAVTGEGTVALHASDVVERTTAPEDLPGEVCAIQFRTTGTPLDWMDGWVSFYRPASSVEPGILGRLCVARLKSGPVVVATVKRGYGENTYNLSGPVTRESVALEWATPILLTRH